MRRSDWKSKALTLVALLSTVPAVTAAALEAERAGQGSSQPQVRQASSCGCSGASDCTCKKGKCKCKKCPHRRARSVVEPLKEAQSGRVDKPLKPARQQTEARAGFFI